MIVIAVIITIIVGWIGTAFGYEILNFPQLGTILSVAVMGGFILYNINKNNGK